MQYDNSVRIGPEFFSKTFNDYADKWWAIIREFAQNSVDARSNRIEISVEAEDGHTALTVTNDGEPMSREILTEKLLTLGGTGKNFEDTVGGFGRAKELLYYCHRSYTIHSGPFWVDGSGAGYDLRDDAPFRHGTSSRIVIDNDVKTELLDAAKQFAAYAQWKGEILINGELHESDLRKGSPRRDLGFGKVYTNRTFPNRLVVRIGGVPMFFEPIGLDRCVVVELDGSSSERLTSNRDSLRSPYNWELTDFITELSVDKRSALKQREPTYRHYEGEKFQHVIATDIAALVTGFNAAAKAEHTAISSRETAAGERCRSFGQQPGGVPASTVSVASEFIIKNETGMEIPGYFLPEQPEFSVYSQKLVRIWGRLLLELHQLLNHSACFAIGFLFDEDNEAEFEDGRFGPVYYINPSVVVRQQLSGSRSLRKRFKLTERHRLLAIAVHEIVHGLGYYRHDEEYAGRLTDVMGVVMANLRRFNKCFVR